MTKQDVYFVTVHVAAFFVAYSAGMAALVHANPGFSSWFDWGCLNQGLVASGAAAIGASIPNGLSSSSMSRFLRRGSTVGETGQGMGSTSEMGKPSLKGPVKWSDIKQRQLQPEPIPLVTPEVGAPSLDAEEAKYDYFSKLLDRWVSEHKVKGE